MNFKNRTLLVSGLVVLFLLAVVLFELAPPKEIALISADNTFLNCNVLVKNEYGELVRLEIEDLNALRDCLSSVKIVRIDQELFQFFWPDVQIVFVESNNGELVNVLFGERAVVIRDGIVYEIIGAEQLIRDLEELFGIDTGLDEFVPYKPI